MEKIILSNLKDGESVKGFVLLVDIEEKTTKHGNAYCVFTVTDGIISIGANLWNQEKKNIIVDINTIIIVEIAAKKYNDSLTYELLRYYPVTEWDAQCTVLDFIKKPPYDPEQMYNEIINICLSSLPKDNNETRLPHLVKYIYEDNKEKLLYWSAAKSVHHNFYAGLLYHVFRMLRLATAVVRVYPYIDAELLYAAVALHDIGKLIELETTELGSADYSILGNMFGHLQLGLEIITEAAKKFLIDEEKIMCLKHCIASHHGKLEWGAISVPSLKEAHLLFLIDMIDSRIEQIEKQESIMDAGKISDNIYTLGGRIYKPSFREEQEK